MLRWHMRYVLITNPSSVYKFAYHMILSHSNINEQKNKQLLLNKATTMQNLHQKIYKLSLILTIKSIIKLTMCNVQLFCIIRNASENIKSEICTRDLHTVVFFAFSLSLSPLDSLDWLLQIKRQQSKVWGVQAMLVDQDCLQLQLFHSWIFSLFFHCFASLIVMGDVWAVCDKKLAMTLTNHYEFLFTLPTHKFLE